MEQITLGQIAAFLGCLAGIIASVTVIGGVLKKWMLKLFKEEFETFNETLKDLRKHIDDVDVETCKNHLITVLSAVERGETLQELEMERFWEEYSHYGERGGNSYIERKVEQLKAKGWI